MDGQSYEVIAEIAIALAGFSGVATALQRRAQDGFSERDRLALSQMLIWSGLALAFALLPGALVDSGISLDMAQRVCGFGLGLLMLAFSIFVLYRNRQIESAGDRGPFPYLYFTLPLAVFIEIGALLLNGVGLIGPNPGIFRLGLITCLSIGFIVFAGWLIYRIE
jgi:hypothetical protein